MSAREDLLGLIGQWKHWTELEGTGLQEANWTAVLQCQEAKKDLQSQILQVRAALDEQISALPPSMQGEHTPWRSAILEMVAMEKANQAILHAQAEKIQRRRAELTMSSQNLNKVHRSYTQRAQANWQSYS